MLGDCPECEGKLQERRGKYGAFAGCENYPDCRYTADLGTAQRQASGVTSEDLEAHKRRLESLKERAWKHFEGSGDALLQVADDPA